jgi:hypothetical protein
MEDMGAKLTPETRERLQHALARLQQEPRARDRRVQERRVAQLPSWLLIDERRSSLDRRRAERRTP